MPRPAAAKSLMTRTRVKPKRCAISVSSTCHGRLVRTAAAVLDRSGHREARGFDTRRMRRDLGFARETLR